MARNLLSTVVPKDQKNDMTENFMELHLNQRNQNWYFNKTFKAKVDLCT